MSNVTFWKVIGFNVGSINFIAENIVLRTSNIFRFVPPLEGRSSNKTGGIISSLTRSYVSNTSFIEEKIGVIKENASKVG